MYINVVREASNSTLHSNKHGARLFRHHHSDAYNVQDLAPRLTPRYTPKGRLVKLDTACCFFSRVTVAAAAHIARDNYLDPMMSLIYGRIGPSNTTTSIRCWFYVTPQIETALRVTTSTHHVTHTLPDVGLMQVCKRGEGRERSTKRARPVAVSRRHDHVQMTVINYVDCTSEVVRMAAAVAATDARNSRDELLEAKMKDGSSFRCATRIIISDAAQWRYSSAGRRYELVPRLLAVSHQCQQFSRCTERRAQFFILA